MIVPHIAPMPHGGNRQYGGTPHHGIWNKTDRRFQMSYKNRIYKVAQLVCEAFHGPKPFDGSVVMHIDENSANNRPENLKWATQKENLNCPQFIKYCHSRTGGNSPRAKWLKKQTEKAA